MGDTTAVGFGQLLSSALPSCDTPSMAFSVVVPTPQGTVRRTFGDEAAYAIASGVLTIQDTRGGNTARHLSPGAWIEVADGIDPIF